MRRLFKLVKVVVLLATGAMAYDAALVLGLDDQTFDAHVRDIRRRREQIRAKRQQPRQRSF